MARRDFNPVDIFLQLDADIMRRGPRVALHRVLFQPSVDMYETDTALIVKMELAGVRPERIGIELSADDRTLTVAGDRNETAEEHRDRMRCYQLEIYYGTFEREIALPANVSIDREMITANYREGFLVIALPKKQSDGSGKRSIEITAG